MLTLLWIIAVIAGFVALAYVNAPGRVWTAATALALIAAWLAHALPPLVVAVASLAFVILAIPLNVPPLRRKLISDGVLASFRKIMPPMSDTEREALEAGSVWWDGELFSGRPDWKRLLATPVPALTAEEQRFLDEDVDDVVRHGQDWEATTSIGTCRRRPGSSSRTGAFSA